MKLGYARVSTLDQSLDLQTDALRLAGCEHVFCDKVSGTLAHKPGFEQLMAKLAEGDTLVVWKLDRLGRSTRQLVQLVETLGMRGIHLCSLNDPVDTSSASGRLVFQIFCALAEHERSLAVERTRAGLESARARGRKGGRPKGLAPHLQQIAPAVRTLYEAGQQSNAQLMAYFRIGSRRTLYKVLRFAGTVIAAKAEETPES